MVWLGSIAHLFAIFVQPTIDIHRRSSSAPPECLRRCKAIRRRRLGLRPTEAPSLLSMVIIVFCILLQPKGSLMYSLYLFRLGSTSSIVYRSALITPFIPLIATYSLKIHVNATIQTNPSLDALNICTISEIIAKRRWSELKKVLKDTDHNQILQQLFDSNGNPSLVLMYFTWLERDYGVSHSLEHSYRLLNLLAKAKLYPKIKTLLNDFVAQKEGHSNSSIFHALSLVDDWFCGNSVLVDMLILAYVKNLKVDLAVEAFKLAGQYGVELSVTSCNTMLAASVNQAGKLQKARDLMEDMKVWGISPTVVTYNTLINGYCKKESVGRMYKADALLKEMLSKKICPNEITYTTLIDGFCEDENLPAAMKVFKDMEM
ncbi:hypothetical protein Ancab_000644 [Ancistrocladus abbreviatus]